MVRKEMDSEEKRLDVMMEVDRQNAIRIQEEIERKRKEERLIGKMNFFCQKAIIAFKNVTKSEYLGSGY